MSANKQNGLQGKTTFTAAASTEKMYTLPENPRVDNRRLPFGVVNTNEPADGRTNGLLKRSCAEANDQNGTSNAAVSTSTYLSFTSEGNSTVRKGLPLRGIHFDGIDGVPGRASLGERIFLLHNSSTQMFLQVDVN
jgi:hypothetical protein